MSTSPITLYYNPLCPFAHRAWIASVEKQVKVQLFQIPLSNELKFLELSGLTPQEAASHFPSIAHYTQKTYTELEEFKSWYKRNINSLGEVPVIEIDGKKVPESEIGAEFLDDYFSDQGTKLVPSDPFKRAQARVIMKTFNTGFFYGLLQNQDPEKDEEYIQKIQAGLSNLLSKFSPLSEGPYAIGKEYSIADIHMVPFFDRFVPVLKRYRDFDVLGCLNKEEKERLKAWWEAVTSRESYKSTTFGEKNYNPCYQGYAHALKWQDGKWIGRDSK